MTHVILAINPGSTSTKVALYEDEVPISGEVIHHPGETLAGFAHIIDQYPFRLCTLVDCLIRHGNLLVREERRRESLDKVDWDSSNWDPPLSAVVGRGGILRSIPGGTYRVNKRMLEELCAPGEREHASNLGALLACEIAKAAGVEAYIVDPVCVDEFDDIARISGLPEIERKSLSHALNLKAAARRAAADLGRRYEEINIVVVHMGGGISVSPHQRGRMVDVNQALDGTGPFSPERAGGLPIGDLVRMCYSGKYTYPEMIRKIAGKGGLVAHLGTNDAREVERRIAQGDAHARFIYEAMAYQIAKEIGLMSTVLKGEVDAIALTGGLAHSSMLTDWIRGRIEWIAPLLIYPGQDEMLSMVRGTLRVLQGEEEAKEYAPGSHQPAGGGRHGRGPTSSPAVPHSLPADQ